MNVTEQTLMAYADDELDAAARRSVEDAIREDPALATRIAEFRAQRARLQEAFAAQLDEPVPERLLTALRATRPGAPVADLARAREAADMRGKLVPKVRYLALAASALVAFGAGLFAWQQARPLRHVGGSLVAGGALARGLSDQLSGDQGVAGMRVGLSFLDRQGVYCRAFTLQARTASAGLACREAGRWAVKALVPTEVEGPYRAAGSSLPPEILAAIQARIAGEPLDRDGERVARSARWLTPPRR